MKNALKIFKKEIKEVIRSKGIWLPVLIVAILFSVVLPAGFILSGDALLKDADILKFINKVFPGAENPFALLVDFIAKQLMVLLLLIPAMIPSLIAPSSILIEKESRTLEPMLATPIKTWEFLMGKVLTSLVPSFIFSTICFVLLTITVDITATIKLGITPLPTPEMFLAAFVLSPILSFIITILSIQVSSRTTDIKSAQGIGAMVIFPIYAIIGMQIAGLFLINMTYLLIACGVLLLLCPLVLKLGIRVFDRENILTKWKNK